MYTYHLASGFSVSTSEQARTLLLVAMMKGDFAGAEEAHRILTALEQLGQ